jgi:hypothetical protein
MHWFDGEEPPRCSEGTHQHQRVDVHVHRDAVRLPDGTILTAVSFDDADPYGREQLPDFGVYLDKRWQPPWEHELLDWPDFGLPQDRTDFAEALRRLLDRARAGDVVEIGCVGGHGRTGTAIACLAVLAGVVPDEATSWTRNHYCAGAVETSEQEALVAAFR